MVRDKEPTQHKKQIYTYPAIEKRNCKIPVANRQDLSMIFVNRIGRMPQENQQDGQSAKTIEFRNLTGVPAYRTVR